MLVLGALKREQWGRADLKSNRKEGKDISTNQITVLFMEYVRKSSHIYFFCASLTNFILGNGLDKKKEQKDDVHPHISVLNASVVLSGSV